MIFYVIIAVFIGGLMVGRTPEYLGKKIGAREVKYSAIAVLVPFVVVLFLTAIAAVMKSTVAAAPNSGPHGFSEILYAFLSHGQQQRIRVRRADRERALLRDRRRHRDAGRAASSRCCARSRWRGPWAAPAPCRSRRGRFAPTRRCSPACSAAWS